MKETKRPTTNEPEFIDYPYTVCDLTPERREEAKRALEILKASIARMPELRIIHCREHK